MITLVHKVKRVREEEAYTKASSFTPQIGASPVPSQLKNFMII